MTRVTQIPENIFDALACGDISLIQFAVLSLMHRWVDYSTGCVRSFSAGRVLSALHLDVTEANLRSMQRTLRALRTAGWYRDDYKSGDKRPYSAWPVNYRLESSTYQGNFSNSRHAPSIDADTDGEEIILNPSDLKSCAVVRPFDVADSDAEDVADMSSNNQCGQVKDEPKSGADTLQLLSFVWSTCHFIRTKSWASKLLETYPLEEIRYAIVQWLYQQYGGIPPTNIEALKIFFADGLEAVIHAHRDRVKLKIETHPPKEWIEFLEDQRDEQQEPPPNSEEPKS